MTRNGPIHTVPYGDGWANISEGAPAVIQHFATKAAAQAAGRAQAEREGCEHVVHGHDGGITWRADYARRSKVTWRGTLSRVTGRHASSIANERRT